MDDDAVMAVIAAEVCRAGSCYWPMDRIAAVAGVCRRLAQYALRRAAALNLIQIDERPRPGAKTFAEPDHDHVARLARLAQAWPR